MLNFEHAERDILVPLTAEEIHARMSAKSDFLARNHYIYSELENGFRLEPQVNPLKSPTPKVDSYAFIVTGTITEHDTASSIHLAFDADVSGVLYVVLIFVLAIVGIVVFFGAKARTGIPEYTKLLPTGLAILLYAGLSGEQQFAINKVVRLLNQCYLPLQKGE